MGVSRHASKGELRGEQAHESRPLLWERSARKETEVECQSLEQAMFACTCHRLGAVDGGEFGQDILDVTYCQLKHGSLPALPGSRGR
jgi:hypothetical protein